MYTLQILCPRGGTHNHPIDTVQQNGKLAVNCIGFARTVKSNFVMNCEFYSVFLWKVVHTDINNMDHFCMKTKSSKHKRNNQLLYPDHLKYHNVNLIVIYKFFNLLSILYEIICHIRYLV